MITYTVSYKKAGSFGYWKKLKKVKGDGILENNLSRFFILDDETRIEVSCHDMMFKFSKERFYGIKERMEIEAGQDIKLDKK